MMIRFIEEIRPIGRGEACRPRRIGRAPIVHWGAAIAVLALAAGSLAACSKEPEEPRVELLPPWSGVIPTLEGTGQRSSANPPTKPPPTLPAETYLFTPTPDAVRPTPALRSEAETYVVQYGDSLSVIAYRFGVSPAAVMRANGISDPNLLAIGQVLTIPAPSPSEPGPANKILPDSELVDGPAAIYFDLFSEVSAHGGWLSEYQEEIDGRLLTGAEIVQKVSERYSVNPRLLLALLEQQSGWLTRRDLTGALRRYPMGFVATGWEGLFAQLSWAADMLNKGYYQWRAGWAGPYILADGAVVIPGPGLNAGTVGVQEFFSQLYGGADWRQVVGPEGFAATFERLYGNPFERRVEPLLPPGLSQPPMELPFESGVTWSFTGGPHSAWGDWAAWAALDFAPPGFAYGCVLSDAWVTAVADGVILRAENGEVVQDLDGDGYEQTGWDVLYMHIESRERVLPGVYLKAGERVGHPSCEGGVTTGTHVHLARKYNGEWIPADGPIPFNLSGWISAGLGEPYDGLLLRGTDRLEACACRNDANQITR